MTPKPLIPNPNVHDVAAKTRNQGMNSVHGQQTAGRTATASIEPGPFVLAGMIGVNGPLAVRKRLGFPLVGTTMPKQLQIGGSTKKTLLPADSANSGHQKPHHVPLP